MRGVEAGALHVWFGACKEAQIKQHDKFHEAKEAFMKNREERASLQLMVNWLRRQVKGVVGNCVFQWSMGAREATRVEAINIDLVRMKSQLASTEEELLEVEEDLAIEQGSTSKQSAELGALWATADTVRDELEVEIVGLEGEIGRLGRVIVEMKASHAEEVTKVKEEARLKGIMQATAQQSPSDPAAGGESPSGHDPLGVFGVAGDDDDDAVGVGPGLKGMTASDLEAMPAFQAGILLHGKPLSSYEDRAVVDQLISQIQTTQNQTQSMKNLARGLAEQLPLGGSVDAAMRAQAAEELVKAHAGSFSYADLAWMMQRASIQLMGRTMDAFLSGERVSLVDSLVDSLCLSLSLPRLAIALLA